MRAALGPLLASLTELQETGRRWSGVRSLTPAALAEAELLVAAWDAERRRERGKRRVSGSLAASRCAMPCRPRA